MSTSMQTDDRDREKETERHHNEHMVCGRVHVIVQSVPQVNECDQVETDSSSPRLAKHSSGGVALRESILAPGCRRIVLDYRYQKD